MRVKAQEFGISACVARANPELDFNFLKFTSRKTPIFAEFSKSMEELFDVASPGSKTDSG